MLVAPWENAKVELCCSLSDGVEDWEPSISQSAKGLCDRKRPLHGLALSRRAGMPLLLVLASKMLRVGRFLSFSS